MKKYLKKTVAIITAAVLFLMPETVMADLLPGDVNGDGMVSVADIVLLSRYFQSGKTLEIHMEEANVNDDGKVNEEDLDLLRLYMAGGYGVELLSSSDTICGHTMEHYAAQAATANQSGHKEYWYCTKCKKYFYDEEGEIETTYNDTVIPPTGSYKVSWNTGTGYTITVTRTASPTNQGSIGTLSNGSVIYPGDVLSVTYAATTGYTISSKGGTSFTVSGNLTSANIYVNVTANNYTYNVVYKSSNGTSLGSTTVTKAFGTTNTISAPAKTGYTTPGSQSVKWDSTSAKTITFTYTPSSVSTSQTVASGTWHSFKGSSGTTYYIKYSVAAEYRNRTSKNVQIRLKWTNTIDKNCYYGYGQYFTGKIGGTTTGQVTICTNSTWSSSSTSSRSKTVYSDWITVSASATTTSVSLSATYKDNNSKSGSWSKTMKIPAY